MQVKAYLVPKHNTTSAILHCSTAGFSSFRGNSSYIKELDSCISIINFITLTSQTI